jgi:hypothetical protein
MGGLDARYLISKLGYGTKVASLTTISTPHRGSPLADVALGLTESSILSESEAFEAIVEIVGQTDTAALDRIVQDDFDGPIDLIIDDASHFVSETRISFNALFSRLRPGGVYLVEDWSWAHRMEPGLIADRPASLFRNRREAGSLHRPGYSPRAVRRGQHIPSRRRGGEPQTPGAASHGDVGGPGPGELEAADLPAGRALRREPRRPQVLPTRARIAASESSGTAAISCRVYASLGIA